MSTAYLLEDLGLSDDTEVVGLCRAFPEIAPIRFSDNEYLVRAGEAALEIFLLLKGAAVVEHANASDTPQPSQTLAVLEASPEAPVFTGEMAYLGNGRRSASVRSAMSTWTLRLQPRHIDGIIERFPGLTQILCRQFALRLHEADDQLRRFQELHAVRATPRFLSAGETLFKAGHPGDILYQLIEGRIRLVTSEGEHVVDATGSQPCFLEPGPYFNNRPYSGDAIAESPATVIGMDSASRLAVIRNFPELLLGLL